MLAIFFIVYRFCRCDVWSIRISNEHTVRKRTHLRRAEVVYPGARFSKNLMTNLRKTYENV